MNGDVLREIASYLSIDDYINFEAAGPQYKYHLNEKFVNAKLFHKNVPFSFPLPLRLLSSLQSVRSLSHITLNDLYLCCAYCKRVKHTILYHINDEIFTRSSLRTMRSIPGLTQEQEKIASYKPSPGEIILVQAFAGTGKTTVLSEFSKRNEHLRILYLAFNNELSVSAKNGTLGQLGNVTVSTIHSLAFIQDEFTLKNLSVKRISSHLEISLQDSSIIKYTLLHYFASSNKNITLSPKYDLASIVIENYFVSLSKKLWTDMKSKLFPMCHDGYLKIFQLSKPSLSYDVIMLDEAQDSTPCILNIIHRQKRSVRIFVGDIHQQIYNFRGVCNPFDVLSGTNLTLSTTFRFGAHLAHFTNEFLSNFKKETKHIETNVTNTFINRPIPPSKQYTIITRTNSNLFVEAFELTPKFVHIVGSSINFDKEILIAHQIRNLFQNLPVTHPKLKDLNVHTVTNWFTELGSFKWLTRIRLYKRYGESLIHRYHDLSFRFRSVAEADVIISTAHQSKGLEYDHVVLANDFISLISSETNKIFTYDTPSGIESYNILYVAMTRARKSLRLNSELNKFMTLISHWCIKCSITPQACHTCGIHTSFGYQDSPFDWLVPLCSSCSSKKLILT
jgi:F-box protein 18 (helicase)